MQPLVPQEKCGDRQAAKSSACRWASSRSDNARYAGPLAALVGFTGLGQIVEHAHREPPRFEDCIPRAGSEAPRHDDQAAYGTVRPGGRAWPIGSTLDAVLPGMQSPVVAGMRPEPTSRRAGRLGVVVRPARGDAAHGHERDGDRAGGESSGRVGESPRDARRGGSGHAGALSSRP